MGSSTLLHARDAGRKAADDALTADDAKLVIVFCSDRYQLESLLGGVNERAAGVPVIGCSTAGEISTSGPGDTSVVVVALGGDGFSVATALATDASDDLRAAGAHAAACITGVDGRKHRTLILLTDGLAGNQQEIVCGAHSVVGAGVPLVLDPMEDDSPGR